MKINKFFRYPYRFDYFYVLFLIIISLTSIFIKINSLRNLKKRTVIIESSLNEKIILNIDSDTIINIEGVLGISQIEISEGNVRFLSSPCKNKLCVKRGFLSNSGDNFACVPNRISIKISSDEGIDAISR